MEHATGSIRIENRSSGRLFFVYISPNAPREAGGDRLGSAEVVAPQAVRDWRIEPGLYDVVVEREDGDTTTFRGVRVTADALRVCTVV